MGFWNGRVTYVRYRVEGEPFAANEALLEQAERHSIGQHGAEARADGVSCGWAGGDHVLDVSFDATKNLLDDALYLAIRLDSDKVPADLLRAYAKIETDALAAQNPTGFPTKAQRQEGKEKAVARAVSESADGRFRRRKFFPVLWDGQSNSLFAGSTSNSVLDCLLPLFSETFGRSLHLVSAGRLAALQAEARGLICTVDECAPASFVGEDSVPASIAWAGDSSLPDFWGNEFLLWLWHTLQMDGDTITLPDGSNATVMLAKTLTLDCPWGQTGRDMLTDEGPTRLPEAFRALQAGKLPRKAGLVVVRQGAQYEFTLQAETLAVAGLAMPKAEGAAGREAQLARLASLRHLVETLDLLYDAFGRRRTGPDWTGELGRIRRWLRAA